MELPLTGGVRLSTHLTVRLLLTCLYVSAALLWYAITPPFEAPDENDHFAFVRFLAVERQLPDPRPETRVGWDPHEWIQPPLYYVLLAPIVARVGAEDPFSFIRANPRSPFNGGTAGGPGAFRTFRWDGRRRPGTDALFYTRLVSLAFGGLTVILIFRVAARVLSSTGQAGVAVAALALVPQYSFLSAALNNDTLATLLSTVAMGSIVDLWRTPELSMRAAGAIGFLAGAALVTKVNTAFLFPMIVLAAILRGRGRSKRATAFLLVAGAGAALSAGWHFVRNALVFGDPLASRFKLEIFASTIQPTRLALTDPYFYAGLPASLFRTFWGAFGWTTIMPPAWVMIGYAALTGVLAALVMAYLVGLARPHRVHPVERQIAVTLAAGVAGVVVEAVGYNVTWPGANQARYFYPALGPLVILLALAVRHAGAHFPWPRARTWSLIVLLVALALAWTVSFRSGLVGFHLEG